MNIPWKCLKPVKGIKIHFVKIYSESFVHLWGGGVMNIDTCKHPLLNVTENLATFVLPITRFNTFHYTCGPLTP